MRVRKAATALAVIATGILGLSLPASALDCHNVSRNVSSAEVTFAMSSSPIVAFPIGVDPANGQHVFWNVMPELKGNWYLLAITEGAPEPAGTTLVVWWGFIPPGSLGPNGPGAGANGNYTNGQVDDLLGMAACPTARQVVHGIQSGACGGVTLP